LSEYTIGDDGYAAAPPPTDDQGQDPGAPEETPDPKELSRQVADLQRQLDREAKSRQQDEERAKFWYEKAQARLVDYQPQPQQVAPVDDEDDLELGDELLNIVSENKKGELAKAIKKLVVKQLDSRKFATLDDVNSTVSRKADEMTALNPYFIKHPELNDPESDLTQAVVRHVNAIKSDPSYSSLPPVKMAEIAIQQARLELMESGKMQGQQQQPQAPDPQQAERARQAKISAQSGTQGRRPTAPAANTASARLAAMSPEEQAAVVKTVNGYGMTLDQYFSMAPQQLGGRDGGR
jgi:hypothetical protein